MNTELGNVNTIRTVSGNNFVDRLRYLAADRSLTATMKGAGYTGGTVSRVLNEQEFIPGTEMLRVLARIENARLDWLVDGHGAPFRVSRAATPYGVVDGAQALLADEDWDVTLYVSDHVPPVVVLAQPATVQRNSRTIRYTLLELITGPVDTDSLAKLMVMADRRVRVDSASLADLADGHTAGTYRLTKAPDLPFAHRMVEATQRIAEAGPIEGEYGARPFGTSVSGDEQRLLDAYRALSVNQRGVAHRLLAALHDDVGKTGSDCG